jgi:hypothetical protein
MSDRNRAEIIRAVFAAWMSNDRKASKTRSRGFSLRPGAAIPPAITSEIISQDMSVPQKPVRLVPERWFAAGLLN